MSKFEGRVVDIELIQELRDRAQGGADVPELVDLLQQRLQLDAQNAVIPTIFYFRTAFELSLRDALPLREWIGGRDRSEVDSRLIPAMERTKSRWGSKAIVPS
jgi:hypothetical protein